MEKNWFQRLQSQQQAYHFSHTNVISWDDQFLYNFTKPATNIFWHQDHVLSKWATWKVSSFIEIVHICGHGARNSCTFWTVRKDHPKACLKTASKVYDLLHSICSVLEPKNQIINWPTSLTLCHISPDPSATASRTHGQPVPQWCLVSVPSPSLAACLPT